MYSAIILKEWLKTRRVFFLGLILSLLLAVYAILTMNSAIKTFGVVSIWLNMLLKDVSMVDVITYLPLAIGIALGVAQMAPEMSHKRLKLTLHLPYPNMKLIALMLSTGIIEIFVISVIQMAVIAVYDLTILHPYLVGRVMLTMLPWYLAGFLGYMFTAAICLEGTWRMRILLALPSIAILMTLFMQSGVMAAYNRMLLIIILLIIWVAVLSFGSIIRFKEGLQD